VLISVSIQDLKPDPQNVPTFYLANIYQVLAEPNVSHASIPFPLANPLDFSPPKYAIWVNSLWFLSLSISLACALLATLQQYWIHAYLATQALQSKPARRARMHMFRHQGIAKMSFVRISTITNALMHFSLFLFFTGLLIYLFNVNQIAFYAIVWFTVTSAMIYLIITLMPVCYINTPCGSPFSPPVCQALAAIIRWIFDGLNSFRRVKHPDTKYIDFLRKIKSKGYTNAYFKIGSELSPDIECQILDRTIDSVASSPELEWAFRRFCDFVSPPKIHKYKWSSAVARFSSSTFFSSSLSGWDKIRRLDLCMKVADLANVREAGLDFLDTVLDRQHHVLRYFAKPGDIIKGKLAQGHQRVGIWAQILIAVIIADVQRDDHGWIALVKDQLGESRYIDQDYHHPGDNSVLLINLIHITNQIILCSEDKHGLARAALPRIFRSLSNFDIQGTPPELQDEFLALWDRIDREATTSKIHLLIRDNLSNLRHGLPATRGRDDAPTALSLPYSGPRGNPPDTTFLDKSINENTLTTITPTDYVSLQGASANNADPPPRSPLPIPEHAIAEPTDGSPPGGASDESQRITQVDASSHSTPEPLKPPGPPPDSVADTSSTGRGQSTLGHNPNNLPLVDTNLPTDVASANISSGGVRSPCPAPISVPSPATLQVASASDPSGTATAPFSMRHEIQDLKDPVETELTYQSDPSAEHCDRSNIDTAVPHG
jgi:Family of unknown function (DUF6535)